MFSIRKISYICLSLLCLLLIYNCKPKVNKVDSAEKWLQEARMLFDKDKYEEAIKLYYKCLSTLDGSGIQELDIESEVYNDLADLYRKRGLYTLALEAYYKKHSLDLQINDPCHITLSLRDIGLTYLYMNQMDSSYHYLMKAFESAKQTTDSIYLTDIVHNDMSLFYSRTENYNEALEHLRKIHYPIEEVYSNKGFAFMKLHNYDSAYYNLTQGTLSKDLNIQANSYCSLAELEGEYENYQEAYFYLNKYQDLINHIQNNNHTSEIQALTLKHNNEIQTTKIKSRFNQTLFILITVIIIIIITAYFLYSIGIKKKEIQRQEQENEVLKKEKEILLMNEMQYSKFKEKSIYKHILELEKADKKSRKPLTYEEQETLRNELNFYFHFLIKDIETACPSIKNDDITFCCLAKLNLSFSTIGLCLGYSDTNSLRQRKYRIRKKMTEDSSNEELYDNIFGNDNQ